MSRGIRLNNPGNIRISGAPWLGKLTPSKDPEFETFDTPAHGIRALARTLFTYQQNHGLNTIKDIISRWAPPTENNTEAYISTVCKQTDCEATDPIDLRDCDQLAALCEAIITQENGSQPYSVETVDIGVKLALQN